MATELDRTLAGADQRALFAGLADRQLEASYRLAGVILGDPFEAEDATHDAVVAAWKRYRSLRDPDRFEAWFQRILVNTCRDRLRRRRRRQPVAGIELSQLRAGHDAYAQVEDRLSLDQAFEGLTPDQRLVVVLRFYADLEVHAIARLLGIPPGTVKSRLHTATQKLHAALDEGREGPR